LKRFAVITEGEGELLFIKHLLLLLFDNSSIKISCIKLNSDDATEADYNYSPPDPKYHFIIIAVGTDEKVTSYLIEQASSFNSDRYEKLFCIRDMYCQRYDKLAKGQINISVGKRIIKKTNEVINAHISNEMLYVFAIMEFEAWLLGIKDLFNKYNHKLTIDIIESKIGYNLDCVDPENLFFKPSNILGKIFLLINKKYTKSKDIIKSFLSHINLDDLNELHKNGKCKSFSRLFNGLSELSNLS